jgi:hypothetical protein
MYLPRYYYKGVNNFKTAKKHFFLSPLTTTPEASGNYRRRTLANCNPQTGKAVGTQTTGQQLALTDNVTYTTYQIEVTDMKQVRFPSTCNTGFGYAFTDADGKVVGSGTLTMENVFTSQGALASPIDFMDAEGDYDFRNVPDGAVTCYFTCLASLPQTHEAIATDSADIEAIEPDWVEHKPELIGVYQGWAQSSRALTENNVSNVSKFNLYGGLRSISGKITLRGNGDGDNGVTGAWTYDEYGNPTALPSGTCSGTATDFFNLARIRGAGYTTVSYETSKDLANLMMVWFGTRDVESIIGVGGTPAYTTGKRNGVPFDTTSANWNGAAGNNNSNRLNKAWGLEGWTGSMYEWMDKGCFNAPSFAKFFSDKRPKGTTTTPSDYTIDYYYNIVQQDGNERRVKAATTNQRTNVARVRFGRYCDIIAGSYAGDTVYAVCYCAFQSSGNNGSQVRKGLVLGRSHGSAVAYAGVACVGSSSVSALAYAYIGGRLCFFGEIEEE